MLYRERGMSSRGSLLGIPIDALTRAEVLARCREAIAGSKLTHIVTANPEILLQAHADTAYAELLRGAEFIVPDGIGLLVGARLLDQRIPERIPGIELLTEISQLAAGAGKGVFLLGGQFGIAPDAAKMLQKEVPRLSIAAFVPEHDAQDPPPELWTQLEKVHPTVLFVAYGAPKQERWIAQHKQRLEDLGIRVAMGVGGAFDILSGRLPRAPRWMRAIGLEWLWRLWLEPRRLRRIFRATVMFPVIVIRWYAKRA